MAPFLWKISPPRVAQASLYALVRSIGALRIISDRLRMSSFHLSSCVRGYNVSKDVWSALAREVLQRERENETAKTLTLWQSRNTAWLWDMFRAPYPCLCSVVVRSWLDSMHNNWSVDYLSWQVFGNDVYGLKNNLWSSSWLFRRKRNISLLHTYPIKAFRTCILPWEIVRIFANLIFANLHKFAKFAKIMSRKNLYVYSIRPSSWD